MGDEDWVKNVSKGMIKTMGSRNKLFLRMVFGLLLIIFTSGSFARVAWALTTEEEKKLGKRILLEMQGKVEIVRDLTLQAFVNRVGGSLVAQVGPTPFEYKFYLINSPEPNAFAIPGGTICLTTGLFVLAENEHEVAGVLSHEISHVTSRHIAQMIERSKRLNLATLAAVLAGVLAGRGGKGSEAIAVTAMATSEALALKYTREMETDADQNSLHYLIKAGYDPNGMITFLNKIHKISMTSADKIPTYLSTHPALEDRISLLENLLQVGQKAAGPFKPIGNYKKIQANAFVEERDPNVAITHFQSMAEADPQEFNRSYGVGLAYRKMGRLDKSVEVLQKAHSLGSKDLDILRELGIDYFLLGKLDQAIEQLEAKSILSGANQNNDLQRLYYLGRAYQEKGDLSHALPLFLKIQKEIPEFPDVYNNLGSVYGRMNQKGLSHFYFGKYFKWNGDLKSALLHFKTADPWLEKGSSEKEEARQEIKELTGTKQDERIDK